MCEDWGTPHCPTFEDVATGVSCYSGPYKSQVYIIYMYEYSNVHCTYIVQYVSEGKTASNT
jgi:hypothetical protein